MRPAYAKVRGAYAAHEVAVTPFSSGGASTLHDTSDRRFVYKRYTKPESAPRRAVLDQLVALGRGTGGLWDASKPPSSVLATINLPVDVVLDDGGATIGVILPRIPAVFHKPSGRPRGLESLIMVRARPPAARARVGVLFRLAECLRCLHAARLVHGDLSSKNVLWADPPKGAPLAYLIDCDGLVPQDPPPTTGYMTPMWTDPRLLAGRIKAHDQHSDWYALALAMYRGLLLEPGDLTRLDESGRWRRPGRIPSNLDGGVQRALRQALDDPLAVARRPDPLTWLRVLLSAYFQGNRFDPQRLAALDRLADREGKIRRHHGG